MGFLDLFKKQQPAETKAVTLTPQVMRFFDMLDQQGVPAPGLRGFTAYAAYALAYACMQFRATKTAEARLWIATEGEDGDTWATDHELAELLEQPNPDMDMAELMELTQLYLDGTGAALWYKNRDNAGRVVSLYPFSDDEFTVTATPERLYGEFHLHAVGGQQRVDAKEVVYFKRVDPRDLHNGLGPLDAALAHVNIGHDMRRAITASLKNAIRPGAIATTEGDAPMSDAEYERFKAEIAQAYQGVVNDGKVMLAERATFQFLEPMLKKLELGPMSGDVEAAICQCFQIHPVLVLAKLGIENMGGLSDSIGPALDMYYDVAQKPMWGRIQRAATRQLLREVDPNPNTRLKFDLSEITALQDDVLARATEAQTAGKFWTVNEARSHTGQQPLEDGDERGEQFVEQPPVIQMPGEEDGGAEPGFGKVDPNFRNWLRGRVRGGDEEKRLSREYVHRVVDMATRDTEESMLELVSHAELMTDEVKLHDAWGLHRKDHEDEPVTPEQAKRMQEEADAALEQARGRWAVNLKPALESIGNRSVAKAGASVGVSFNQLQPGLLEYVERHAAELITGVTDTTKDKVARAIRDGLESGDGIRGIAKRVEASGAFSRDRAKLIATTEVTTVRNGAALESMQSYADRTGLKVIKTWINSADARVRDAHLNHPVGVGGEKRAINEPFSNGLMAPSEPNCRCSLLMDVE
jgi:HK97 family phage portal protein